MIEITQCKTCKIEIELESVAGFSIVDLGLSLYCEPCLEKFKANRKTVDRKEIDRIRKETFDRVMQPFPIDVIDSIHKADKVQLGRMKKSFVRTLWSLIIKGPTGTGKTFLMARLINDILESHYSYLDGERSINTFKKFIKNGAIDIVTVTSEDMLASIQSNYKSGSSEGMIHKYKTCKILCIDDLGVEKNKEDSRFLINSILCERHKTHLKTIITTNIEDMQSRYNERVSSRFELGEVITVSGADRRIKTELSNGL